MRESYEYRTNSSAACTRYYRRTRLLEDLARKTNNTLPAHARCIEAFLEGGSCRNISLKWH